MRTEDGRVQGRGKEAVLGAKVVHSRNNGKAREGNVVENLEAGASVP